MRLGVFLLVAASLAACSAPQAGKVTVTSAPTQPAPAAPQSSFTIETDDRGIVAEINFMRRDPRAYAQQLLLVAEAFRPGASCASGQEACVLTLPGENNHTIKDARAYRASIIEAAGALRGQSPLPPLQVSATLKASALHHMRELAGGGLPSHIGTDGSSPRARMERRGQVQGRVAENIMLGFNTAFGMVASWLIDHGVADRGHRKNLLDAELGYVGAACGPHPTYRLVCVADFATLAQP